MRRPEGEREQIARRRIVSILTAQTVANLRTLEHKIADAGPNPQRVHPHIITPVKQAMIREGRIVLISTANAQWLHLAEANPLTVAARFEALKPIWENFTATPVARRTGQALEIAIWRALQAAPSIFTIGGFHDVDAHDDSTLFAKQEVQVLNGKSLGKEALDFIAQIDGHLVGVEAKNVRPWLYPHDAEIRAAVRKALTLDVIPVIVARRIQYASFRVLGTCGVIMHETYNQRLANADAAIAEQAKHKDLLGYHDIRTGNAPDARLTRFFADQLPGLLDRSRTSLNQYRDLLEAYTSKDIAYTEFAARVRRRRNGQNEDNDWADEGEFEPQD
jgi:hypothetical protein